jgi:hypothetical protein
MAMGLAPMGRVLFSPSRRNPRSHAVLGASLVPLSPLVSLALPFRLNLRKRLRPVKHSIRIRLLDGLRFRPPPLSALTPSAGPGSSGVSPKFMESRTPTPGLPPVPLAPLNPLPSPVTLSQVEDIVATSDMVRELHSRHHPPSLSSSDLPSSSEMAVDVEDPSLNRSHASSFDPWTETHPAPPLDDSRYAWTTWLEDALDNGVPEDGLAEFIRRISMTATSPLARLKFVRTKLKWLTQATTHPGA